LGVLVWSTRETQIAANAAKQSADAEVASVRGWVVLANYKIPDAIDVNSGPFEFDVKNVGKTPTTGMSLRVEFQVVARDQPIPEMTGIRFESYSPFRELFLAGVFDRSAPLPTGGYLEQADGTAWMALFCQNMFEIGAQLSLNNPAYVEMTLKFILHFLRIGYSIMRAGEGTGMWDEEDGFFYDVLRLPDGRSLRLKVRSMVGLLPLCAATVFEGEVLAQYPELRLQYQRFLEARPELREFIRDVLEQGQHGRMLAAFLKEDNPAAILPLLWR